MVKTAKQIQADGKILAQRGLVNSHGNVRATKCCFFVDFRDMVSILKGIRSLWKHIKKEPAQVRWGFFVLREDASPVTTKTIYGANWVHASLTDVPSSNFDYHVIPPHLPYAAFRVSQFWGKPAMQWAALCNHHALMLRTQCDFKDHNSLVTNLKGAGWNALHGDGHATDKVALNAVVPSSNQKGFWKPSRAKRVGTVAVEGAKVARAWERLFQAGDSYNAILTDLELRGVLGALMTDVSPMLVYADTGNGEFGWGLDSAGVANAMVEMANASGDTSERNEHDEAANAMVEMANASGDATDRNEHDEEASAVVEMANASGDDEEGGENGCGGGEYDNNFSGESQKGNESSDGGNDWDGGGGCVSPVESNSEGSDEDLSHARKRKRKKPVLDESDTDMIERWTSSENENEPEIEKESEKNGDAQPPPLSMEEKVKIQKEKRRARDRNRSELRNANRRAKKLMVKNGDAQPPPLSMEEKVKIQKEKRRARDRNRRELRNENRRRETARKLAAKHANCLVSIESGSEPKPTPL
jgi:hypothetical protein